MNPHDFWGLADTMARKILVKTGKEPYFIDRNMIQQETPELKVKQLLITIAWMHGEEEHRHIQVNLHENDGRILYFCEQDLGEAFELPADCTCVIPTVMNLLMKYLPKES